MQKNLGSTDKMIRYLLALIFIGLFVSKIVVGTIGIILLVLAGIFIFTSLINFCPLYYLFGINTCNNQKKA